jgi:KipI family sensor histidine kinase inhibitor
MITARAAGDAALLVEAGEHAVPLAAAARAARLPGVIDVITGAVTVLLVTEPGRDLAALEREVAALGLPDHAPAAGEVEIPVVYDGPDLAEVARLAGLTEAEVVERHAAGGYTVGWLGFSPGFGYLTGLDPALHVPRLSTPRTRVPAGSVAIAGPLAAVYPSTSPGGWRILGRTSIRLWDTSNDPPAVFAPGVRVTFRPVTDLPSPADPGPDETGRPVAPGGSPGVVIEVLRPGPLATVQDLGRPGYGHLGVSRSGAADPDSLVRANALAGNPPAAAGIELTLGRAAFRFPQGGVIALAGAEAPLTVIAATGEPGRPAEFARAIELPAGAELRVGSPPAGLRTYLAVRGGLAVPAELGSRSSDLLACLGPAPLSAGERLAVAVAEENRDQAQESAPLGPSRAEADGVVTLRVRPGPREDWFAAGALELLCGGEYTVTPASDRTGLRLSGPALTRARAGELPSEGMVTGALQVPPDGQPILLLADHGVTGGYPVIAVVASADLGKAAQLRPGRQIRFTC